MTEFQQLVSGWETFYLLMGTAAATLIGLLFVAVSINIDTFRKEAYTDLQLFAALTFNCFFYVLVIALLFLIPGLSPVGLGLPLFILAGLGLVNALLQQRRALKTQSKRQAAGLASRFTVPIVGLLGLAIFAILVMGQLAVGLYGLVFVIIVLLASAASNAAWLLLVRLDEDETTETP
jgi:hypothetical protein